MVKKSAKTITYDRIGSELTSGLSVPINPEEIGNRVAVLADRFASRAEAAAAMGVSPAALQRYLRGENMPPFDAVARLCSATGTSVDWVAGVQPAETQAASASQPLRIDAEILGKAVYVLNGVLFQINSHMEPQAYAETLLMLVEYLRENEGKLEPTNVVYLMEYIKRRQNERGRAD